jgi:hypothetical protein
MFAEFPRLKITRSTRADALVSRDNMFGLMGNAAFDAERLM